MRPTFSFSLATVLLACLLPGLTAVPAGALAESDPSSGTVRVTGATLRYVIEGKGRPCLVVGSSVYYPRILSNTLRQHLRLIFLDLRHFVPSEPSLEPSLVTLDTYAADIETTRRQLGLGAVLVMGHSIHGNIALEYARRYPTTTSGVIVIGSPPVGVRKMGEAAKQFWETDASDQRKQLLQKNWEGARPRLEALSPSDRFIREYVLNGPKYWYNPAYDASAMWKGMEVNMAIVGQLFGVLFAEYDLAQSPSSLKAPVFLALGRYDYVVPYTLWDSERSKLPRLSYNLFERSGHTPQVEEAVNFDATLLKWLAQK